MISSNYSNATTSGTSFSYPLRYGLNQQTGRLPFYKDVSEYDTQCGCGYISDPVPVSLRPAMFHDRKPHMYMAPVADNMKCDPAYAMGSPFYSSPYRVLDQPEITCNGWCSWPDVSIKHGTKFP